MFILSIAVTLDKREDRVGSADTDEVINLLHQENFYLAGFKEIIKKIRDCQSIVQYVIARCKNV